MLVAKRRPPNISTEVQYKHVEIHHPIILEKPLDCKNCSRKIRKNSDNSTQKQHASGILRSRIHCTASKVSLCLDSKSNCWNALHSKN